MSSSPALLRDDEILEWQSRRTRILSGILGGGVLGMFAVIVPLAMFREPIQLWLSFEFGKAAAGAFPFLGMFAALGLFMCACVACDRWSARNPVQCPGCSHDCSRSVPFVLATRRCRKCGERMMLGGRQRSDAVFKRHQKFQSMQFLRGWLWCWPVLAVGIAAVELISPGTFQACPNARFAPGLIGSAASSWSLIRTFDRRYIPVTVASITMLAIAIWMYA